MKTGINKLKKYREKPSVVEACRWFKNGDHPEDDCKLITDNNGGKFFSEGKIVRYYRSPEGDGRENCSVCGKIMHEHGWIDVSDMGFIVCPGDWIIKEFDNKFRPCRQWLFEEMYEEIK